MTDFRYGVVSYKQSGVRIARVVSISSSDAVPLSPLVLLLLMFLRYCISFRMLWNVQPDCFRVIKRWRGFLIFDMPYRLSLSVVSEV